MIVSFPPPGAGDFFETLGMADSAVPAEPDAFGDLEFLSDVYLDFDGFGCVDLFVDPLSPLVPSVVDPSAALPDAPVELVPSQKMDDIERFLMMDEGGGGGGGEDERVFTDDFFADVLFAGSDEGSVRSGVSNGDAATPEEGEGEGDVEPEANTVAPVVESEKGTDGEESEAKGGEDDEDILSKKRRRQMRNRDSAMKSRERKKLYVRDLEVKSKFLESECRRLQNALHCCAAENIALRQCLEKAKALGASLAKQESAVLFVESLLLGSLFWLVSIVCLFLTPSLLNGNPEKASGVARSPRRSIMGRSGLETSEGPEGGPGLGWEFYWRRRCKALRRKMRICSYVLPLHMVFR